MHLGNSSELRSLIEMQVEGSSEAGERQEEAIWDDNGDWTLIPGTTCAYQLKLIPRFDMSKNTGLSSRCPV